MKQTLTILSLLLFVTTTNGQEASSAHPQLSMIRSVVIEKGWQIPGLARSRIVAPRKLLPKGYGVTGVPLSVTVLSPQRQFMTTISLFGLKPDGKTLVMGERRGMVQSIIKCDVDNRVFVYIVQFVAIVRGARGRVGYGGIYGAQYFDNDGDGVFESYEPGPPFVTSDLRIPHWVLQSK